MNIRQRWWGVKDSLGLELHRLNAMMLSETDQPVDHSRYPKVSGQTIRVEDVVTALAIPFLMAHGGSISVSKKSSTGYGEQYYCLVSCQSSADGWRECAQSNQCPLTLKEADTLLGRLADLTEERVHNAVDTALLAVS